MTDEELGRQIVPPNMSIGWDGWEFERMVRCARALLAKPVASPTDKELEDFINAKMRDPISLVRDALEKYGAASNAPILRMSVEKIGREFMRARGKPDHEELGTVTLSDARVAYRLAQPVPEVEPDAGAMEMTFDHYCAVYWRDMTERRQTPQEVWAPMQETERNFWRRAVAAAAEKGNG